VRWTDGWMDGLGSKDEGGEEEWGKKTKRSEGG